MVEKDIFEKIVPLCPDGIIGVDKKGTVVVFNKAAENLIGYTMDEVIGKLHITQVYHPEKLARRIKKMIYSPDHGGEGKLEGVEVNVTTKQGLAVPIRLSATLIQKNNEEIGSVGFFHDLTLKNEMEARLLELSIRDGLTGLFNHRHFHSVLSKEMERTGRYKRPLSLIVLDLDNLKKCNDEFGHIEGDNILRLVGKTAGKILRGTDSAFRYGGDEFVVILPETRLSSASTVAEKLREEFKSNCPYCNSGKSGLLNCSLSLGVAQANKGEEAESLMKRADLAMYEAKKAGGDRTVEAGVKIGKTV